MKKLTKVFVFIFAVFSVLATSVSANADKFEASTIKEKVKTQAEYYSKGNCVISQTRHSNGKVATLYKYCFKTVNGTKVTVHAEIVKHYTNGKVSFRNIAKSNTKSQLTFAKKDWYKSTGATKASKKLYYKKGKASYMLYFVFNKKGQLKSNKYGKAYRYKTTVKKGFWVKKVVKAKYSKKGKLGKARKVKVTKATKTF